MNSKNYKELLSIAFPATLESLFVVMVTLMDTWMVSPLGTTAISAVTIAVQPKLFLFLAFTALGTATTIGVSQAFGRDSRQDANAVLMFSHKASAIWSIVLSALTIIFAWPIMVVCSNQQDTMDMSVIFLRIIMVGMVFQALSTVMNAALRGIGQMKATLLSNVVMGVVDIIFNYLLIEGHLGFPAWGIAGAALATTLGNVAGFLVSLSYLFREENYLSFPFCRKSQVRVYSADAQEMKHKLINVFAENIFMRIGFLISGIIVARLGSYETSIYSVGMQLLGLSFAFGDGIQVAVLTLVGRSVGAGDREGCGVYVRTGISLGIMVSAVVAIACVALGGPFFGLFSSLSGFTESGGVVSVFVAVIVPFQIIRIVRVSVLRGMGDTKTPAKIATISTLVLDPPLSLLFAIVLGMGQWGLWIGTLLSQIAWFAMAQAASRKALAEYQDDKGTGPLSSFGE